MSTENRHREDPCGFVIPVIVVMLVTALYNYMYPQPDRHGVRQRSPFWVEYEDLIGVEPLNDDHGIRVIPHSLLGLGPDDLGSDLERIRIAQLERSHRAGSSNAAEGGTPDRLHSWELENVVELHGRIYEWAEGCSSCTTLVGSSEDDEEYEEFEVYEEYEEYEQDEDYEEYEEEGRFFFC